MSIGCDKSLQQIWWGIWLLQPWFGGVTTNLSYFGYGMFDLHRNALFFDDHAEGQHDNVKAQEVVD